MSQPLRGEKLEKWLEENGEPENYNPWVKLEKPHISGKDEYQYGFKCFNCGNIDDGSYSKNQDVQPGYTKLCTKCFYSLPGVEI